MLAGIRQGVMRMLSEVHNYACRETIERSMLNRGARKWTRTDSFALDVAHIDGTDLYAVPGGEFSRTLPAPGRGALARGDFAGHLRTVFTGKDSKITFHGRKPLGRTQALRYDFVIPATGADWLLRDDWRVARVGARGSFWADPRSLDLLRLEIQAEGIPRELAFRSAKQRIDYARMRIGSAIALLPQTAELNTVVREDLWPRWNGTTRTEQRNLIEFSHCRQYQAESSVSFGGENLELLPGASLRAKLSSPIDLARAAAGDPVAAVLEEAVAVRSGSTVPAGAFLTGRIRSIEKAPGGFTVALEFSQVLARDGQAMFFGEIQSIGLGDAGIELVEPRMPAGVLTLRVRAARATLEGLRMTWRIGATAGGESR